MKTVGFGVVGIGRQGLRLAEHIRKDIRPGKLVAVCRRSKSGHDYSKKHGIKFYSNYHDLLADKDIDAVVVTTPSSLHGIQARDSLKAKKHVLIDKPIASTLEEGRKIKALAKEKKLIVGVNFPLRVNSVTKTLKSNMKNIGKLMKIQVFVSHGPPRNKWQSDLELSNGGVILDLGSHYFDLISFLTGCQPEIISNAYSEELENEHSSFINIAYKDFSVSMVLLRNQKLVLSLQITL
jgi:predicted dehydrogenase